MLQEADDPKHRSRLCNQWKQENHIVTLDWPSQSPDLENVNSVYGPDTVTANHAQFWFRRFRSGNFDVKDAPRSGRPIIEKIDQIMEIAESKHRLRLSRT